MFEQKPVMRLPSFSYEFLFFRLGSGMAPKACDRKQESKIMGRVWESALEVWESTLAQTLSKQSPGTRKMRYQFSGVAHRLEGQE